MSELFPGFTGTHMEPSGADGKGPDVEVCDDCRCDVKWKPGFLCNTPQVHVYEEPPYDPEEGDPPDDDGRAQGEAGGGSGPDAGDGG